jgi:hypothetical protein
MLSMAADLARSLDPALFAERCGFEPDIWQRDLLREQPKRCILLASRQVGKSTVTALETVYIATTEPGSLCAVISPSQRQSNEFVRSAKHMLQHLDGAPEYRDSVTKIEFETGSRILSLPGGEDGATVRGLSGARLIVIDEAARVPDSLLGVVRPMMATRSDAALWILSTPAGKSGFFHDSWHSLDESWHRVKVSATDCPRISPAFLEEERRALGQTMFESEYGLIFHDLLMAAVPANVIEGIFDKELLPLWPT